MVKLVGRLLVLGLVLIGLAGCAPANDGRPPQRIAAPPPLVALFSKNLPPSMGETAFVPLRPYDRARDLEVLLLSSGSTAFTGMMIPGRSVYLMKRWVRPLPVAWLNGVRPDVAAGLKGPEGAWALPVTLDGAVLVYRVDLWHRLSLPPPDSLAALRDGLLNVRTAVTGVTRPVVCAVPVDELFWDLAWSFEGEADPAIYTYPKIHALRFIQEFALSPEPGGAAAALDELAKGGTAAAFLSGSDVRAFLKAHPAEAKTLSVAPLPSSGGRAMCLYNGLCLVRPLSFKGEPRGWAGLLTPSYQNTIEREGLEPVLKSVKPPHGDPVWAAFQRTRFCAPPELGELGNEFVYGAILDATEASMSPEEALRRAAARLRSRGDGSVQ